MLVCVNVIYKRECRMGTYKAQDGRRLEKCPGKFRNLNKSFLFRPAVKLRDSSQFSQDIRSQRVSSQHLEPNKMSNIEAFCQAITATFFYSFGFVELNLLIQFDLYYYISVSVLGYKHQKRTC